MCAALLTSQVKFNDKTYRITPCETNELYQLSPQHRAGTRLGKMKQKMIFSGMKYLE